MYFNLFVWIFICFLYELQIVNTFIWFTHVKVRKFRRMKGTGQMPRILSWEMHINFQSEVARLLDFRDSKIWTWNARDSGPTMTALASSNSNSSDTPLLRRGREFERHRLRQWNTINEIWNYRSSKHGMAQDKFQCRAVVNTIVDRHCILSIKGDEYLTCCAIMKVSAPWNSLYYLQKF